MLKTKAKLVILNEHVGTSSAKRSWRKARAVTAHGNPTATHCGDGVKAFGHTPGNDWRTLLCLRVPSRALEERTRSIQVLTWATPVSVSTT